MWEGCALDKEKLQALITKSQRQFLVEKNDEINHISRRILSFAYQENDEDFDVLYQFYHRVKGTAGTLELADISRIAAELEALFQDHHQAMNDRDDLLAQLFKETGKLFNRIEMELNRFLLMERAPLDSEKTIDRKHANLGKVLVVDDDISMLSYLEELLKNQGFEVFITDNSKEAIEHLQSVPIDLAIMDLLIADTSGFDIHQHMLDLNIDVPVIFLTGLNSKDLKYKALRSGADYFYQKPVDPEELLARVNGVIKNKQTNDSLNHKDELTGALTRKYFVKRFEDEKQQFLKTNQSFAVAFLDLDKFKQINDRYGHMFGDEILVGFVEVVKGELSDNGQVFRFGGDEFLILIPNSNGEAAKLMINNIRSALEQKSFTLPGKADDVTISFSSGIAVFNQQDMTKTTLLEEADKALYVAKENGKNQTVLQEDTQSITEKRILVVDDELLLANIIKTRLGYLGYQVDYAKDGQEALVKLAENPYDLMLLDIMLPKVTGIEVLKKLKTVSVRVNLKIIMISGKRSESAMLESLRLGADDFLEKPFSLDVLEHKIKKILTT